MAGPSAQNLSWFERLRSTLLVSSAALADDPRISSRSLLPDAIIDTARVQRISELGPRNTRFVPPEDLRAEDSRLPLLREALESGVRLIFAEVELPSDSDAPFPAELSEVVHRLDDPSVPGRGGLFGVSVVDLLRACLASNPTGTAAALTGLRTQHVSREALRSLPADLSVHRLHPIRRFIGDPRAPMYLVVGIYSALRALPVSFIQQFHGSLLVFWLIDVVTAVPYTWAVLAMLFAPRRSTRALATLTVLTTFAAPYVYFWLNGRDYPTYVVIVIALLTVLSVMTEVVKYAQERRLRRRYRSARVATTVRMMPVRMSHAPEITQIMTIHDGEIG